MSLWTGILNIIDSKVDDILSRHIVPSIDSAVNQYIRDVVGNKSDSSAVAGSLVAMLKQVEQEVFEIEKHLHNREIWFGNGAVEDSLTPYTIISGNGIFGTEVLILDTGDTPVDSGMVKFDPHKIEVVSVDTDSEYLLRLIWGSGTVADAETAKQYTTVPVTPSGIGSNVSGPPVPTRAKKIICGTDKVWIKCKNVTNLAEAEVQLGIHEYPR